MFSCKSVRLNLNRKSGRKNAFLSNSTRVCGSTDCQDVCNLKPSDSNEELEAPDLGAVRLQVQIRMGLQNRVDLELQSGSKADVQLNSSST